MTSHARWTIAGVLGVLAIGLGLLALTGLADPPAATRPVESAGEPSPSTKPKDPAPRVKTYPGPELVSACDAAADKLRGELDGGLRILVQPPFVIAGNLDEKALNRYAEGTVVAAAKALWAGYFDRRPDQVITVLLLADDRTYRLWAKKLFGDTDVSHFGYYKPDLRTMVMNIGTGGGTLVHELTHALIVYDFPNVPTWFDEGFASLHEGCRVGEDVLVGLVNWRLPALQAAVKGGTLRPLRELIVRRDFRGRLEGLNYAQSRYFVMYMQQQDLLKKFYRQFHELYTSSGRKPAPEDDVKAVEQVFGKTIDEIDKACRAWVMTLEYK